MYADTQVAIDEVMNAFDFEKAHKMMAATDWVWGDKGLPTVEMLKECALDLLGDVVGKLDGHSVSTGGLQASRSEFQGRKHFILEFIGVRDRGWFPKDKHEPQTA